MGGRLRPEMARVHFATIAEATDLPLIVFQYPAATGLGYPLDTLLQLFEAVPTIAAMKDWSNDPALHERHTRVLQGLPRPVTLLTTHSAWLMASLTMGANGLLSGAGSVMAGLQVALFEAVRARDLARAQALNERIWPLAEAFYAEPFLDMHNRMKECLVLQGKLDKAVVRPPLMNAAAGGDRASRRRPGGGRAAGRRERRLGRRIDPPATAQTVRLCMKPSVDSGAMASERRRKVCQLS